MSPDDWGVWPGQAIVGATTRAALAPEIEADIFSVLPLGPVSVKGQREPVEAWLLGTS